MTPEEVTQLLDTLMQRLGPAGERLFQLGVRQVYIDSIGMTALFATYLLFGYFAGRRLYRWQQKDDDATFIVLIVGTIYVVLGIFIGLSWAYTFPQMFNPEYWALVKLSNLIRGGS